MNLVVTMSPHLLPFIEFVIYAVALLLTGMWVVDKLSKKMMRVFLARKASLPAPERVKILERWRGRFEIAQAFSATMVFIAFMVFYAFMPALNKDYLALIMLFWVLPLSMLLLTYFMKRMARALDLQIGAIKQDQQRETGKTELPHPD